MEHFNKLTPAQAEAIHCLQEEEGELLQALGKVTRHGWDSRYIVEGVPVDNMGDVEREAGHVLAWLAVLTMTTIRGAAIRHAAEEKLEKLLGPGSDLIHHVPSSVLRDALAYLREPRPLGLR